MAGRARQCEATCCGKIFPNGVDYVFASEDYGETVAGCLDAEFVPVDIERKMRPVSATEVREDPLGHWELLPDCVKPYYL